MLLLRGRGRGQRHCENESPGHYVPPPVIATEIKRRMQNQAQIESMKTEQEQKVLIDRMRNSAMRAIFDPEMPAEQRQAIITMLTGLMGATRELPPPGGTTITQEDV